MKSELKILIERFELEIWLYMDDSLSKTDREFWDNNMEEYPELKNYYVQTQQVLKGYNESSEFNIKEGELNEIINKAAVKTGLTGSIEKGFNFIFADLLNPSLSSAKIVFVSVLSVAALLILLTTERPNPVKSLSGELLDWQGESISQQLDVMGNSLESLSKEEWEKYQYIQKMEDELGESIYLVNDKIEKLKEQIESSSL